MSDSYVECLVTQKAPAWKVFLKFLLLMLAVVFFVLSFGAGVFPLIIAAVCGVAGYFMVMETSVEYEYLYVDREISIDKITGKSRRKNIGKFDTERLEILAPVGSYHLDGYRSRNLSQKDYSIGYETQPDRRYMMVYDGKVKVLLSPSPEFLAAVKSVAPRKVFTD